MGRARGGGGGEGRALLSLLSKSTKITTIIGTAEEKLWWLKSNICPSTSASAKNSSPSISLRGIASTVV